MAHVPSKTAASDRLSPYRQIQRQYPVLKHEEFLALFEKYRAGDLAARDIIVMSNIGLAFKVAIHYMGRGVSQEDLVQEGLAALSAQALPKFDLAFNVHFSTYAFQWLRQAMTRAIQNTSTNRPFRVPVHALEKRRLAYKLEESFREAHGRTPSDEELRVLLSTDGRSTSDRMAIWARSSQRVFSLDASLTQDEDSASYHEVTSVADESLHNTTPEHLVAFQHLARRVMDALNGMKPRAQDIIRRRFGIGCDALTLKEVGDRHDLTRERIRQLEVEAFRLLTMRLKISEDDLSTILEAIAHFTPPRMDEVSAEVADARTAFSLLCEHVLERGDALVVNAPSQTVTTRVGVDLSTANTLLQEMVTAGWLRLALDPERAIILDRTAIKKLAGEDVVWEEPAPAAYGPSPAEQPKPLPRSPKAPKPPVEPPVSMLERLQAAALNVSGRSLVRGAIPLLHHFSPRKNVAQIVRELEALAKDGVITSVDEWRTIEFCHEPVVEEPVVVAELAPVVDLADLLPVPDLPEAPPPPSPPPPMPPPPRLRAPARKAEPRGPWLHPSMHRLQWRRAYWVDTTWVGERFGVEIDEASFRRKMRRSVPVVRYIIAHDGRGHPRTLWHEEELKLALIRRMESHLKP